MHFDACAASLTPMLLDIAAQVGRWPSAGTDAFAREGDAAVRSFPRFWLRCCGVDTCICRCCARVRTGLSQDRWVNRTTHSDRVASTKPRLHHSQASRICRPASSSPPSISTPKIFSLATRTVAAEQSNNRACLLYSGGSWHTPSVPAHAWCRVSTCLLFAWHSVNMLKYGCMHMGTYVFMCA